MRFVVDSKAGLIHDRNGYAKDCGDLGGCEDISLADVEELVRKAGFSFDTACFGDNRFGQWVTSPTASDSLTSSPDSS